MESLTSYIPSAATITGGIRDLTSYIGNTTSSLPSLQPSSVVHRAPRTILWKSFEVLHHNDHEYTFLVLALVDGFIIFQVNSNHSHTSSSSSSVSTPVDVRKVAQFSEAPHAPIHMAKLLYHQPVDGSSYDDNGVLVAVTSADDRASFPRSLVKIYSVARNRYVHVLRFRSRIHAIATSRSTLVVMLQKELHVYRTDGSHPLHFDLVFSTKCFPNHDDNGVMALNHRWLAYGGVDALIAPSSPSLPPMSHHGNNMVNGMNGASPNSSSSSSSSSLLSSLTATMGTAASNNIHSNGHGHNSNSSNHMTTGRSLVDYLPSASDAKETVGAVSKGIVSGLLAVGDFGRRKLAGYVAADNNKDEPMTVATAPLPSSRELPYAGTVIIRDIFDGHVIAHFKAHDDAIGSLHFDPSMTLLTTVSSDGTYIHVYQVVSSSLSSHTNNTNTNNNHRSSSPSLSSQSPSPSLLPGPLELPPTLSSMDNHTSSHTGTRRASVDTHDHSLSPSPSSVSSSPMLITRQLYRIYRGITTATIRSVSFSMNSKWMAVSSASTTHIYGINRFGGMPTLATHGHRGAYHTDTHGASQLFAESSVIKLSSSRRIRVPRSSLANDTLPLAPTWPPIVTAFIRLSHDNNNGNSNSNGNGNDGNMDGSEHLLVLDRDELLTLHQLLPRAPLSSIGTTISHQHHHHDTNELKVDLEVKALSSWDLYTSRACDITQLRDESNNDTKRLTAVTGPWLESSPTAASAASTTSVAHHDYTNSTSVAHPLFALLHTARTDTAANDEMNWLSNVELRPSSSHIIPLWASPQFTIMSYNRASLSSLTRGGHGGSDILSSMRSSSSTAAAASGEPSDGIYDPNYLYYEDLPYDRTTYDSVIADATHQKTAALVTRDDSLESDISDAIGSML